MKMAIYGMTLIIDVVRNIKWMKTLTLCMSPLNRILDINYKYGSLNQPMAQKMLWRLTIFLSLG